MPYKALVIHETPEGFTPSIETLEEAPLPQNHVRIQVHASSLNYKDYLSASGHKGITRAYPHTPGVDAAGVISESNSASYKIGQEVLVTGYDVGMNTPGGLAEQLIVPAEWVVSLPSLLTIKESMMIGSAGFSAALALHKLQANTITPTSGKILVTGASGGVGSLAVGLLCQLGYQTVAATRNPNTQQAYFERLGNPTLISSDTILKVPDKPLLSKDYSAAIDNLGGPALSNLCRMVNYQGVVIACGNILGTELHTSLFPFILRGISLLGISSANCPMPLRQKLWAKLATEWKPNALEAISTQISLEEVPDALNMIKQGQHHGRYVVTL